MLNEYGIGLLIAFGLMAVIWFVFVAPSERRYHEKKLQLLQERIRKRQALMRQESNENQGHDQAHGSLSVGYQS